MESKHIGIIISIIVFLGAMYYFTTKPAEAPAQATPPAATGTEQVTEGYAQQPPKAPAPEQAVVQPVVKKQTTPSNQKNMQATFKTNKGSFTVELNATDAPNTVANFTKLAKEGFYNGVKFHRVIAGFMIQGGDPLTKDDTKSALWGTGGPGYKFADEIHANNKNEVGTISMANAGPNTNGSQFFINVNNNAGLNPKHTVFGKVVSGMDVVTAIENVEVGPQDRPVSPVVIESVTLN